MGSKIGEGTAVGVVGKSNGDAGQWLEEASTSQNAVVVDILPLLLEEASKSRNTEPTQPVVCSSFVPPFIICTSILWF